MPINERHNGDVTLSQMSCLAAQIRAASGSFGYVFINGTEGEPINETSLHRLCTMRVKRAVNIIQG